MRRLAAITMMATAALAAGCVPGIQWLPDSSGFIYTSTDWPMLQEFPKDKIGRLMHFDIATKKTRLIAETKSRTIWPALSPDGKRIAIADAKEERMVAPTLQVIIYDLDGKVCQRSPTIQWGEPSRGNAAEIFTQLFWSPDGDRVLIDSSNRVGVYDVEKNGMKSWAQRRLAIFGLSPIRPDGKGFVVHTTNGGSLGFISWDGTETPITLSPEAEAVNQKARQVLAAPIAFSWSRWDGPTAVATVREGDIRIDTQTATGKFVAVERDKISCDGRDILNQFVFAATGVKVLYVAKIAARDFNDAGLPTAGVYVIDARGGSRSLVADIPHCAMFPSPNGKFVALRYFTRDDERKEKEMIVVVNEKGEVTAELQTAR